MCACSFRGGAAAGDDVAGGGGGGRLLSARSVYTCGCVYCVEFEENECCMRVGGRGIIGCILGIEKTVLMLLR